MSEKRKDNKGRLLRNGETQRKDGKYEYKYIDLRGDRHSIYSWKLVDTDKLPSGKRECESLRSLEKKIEKDLDDGINEFDAKRTTLNDLSYVRLGEQKGLKQSTFLRAKLTYNKHVSNSIGAHKLSEISYATIKNFYLSMIKEGYAISYISNIQSIINPIFEYAIKSNYIRANPTHGVLADIKKEFLWQKPKKYSLTTAEQKALIDFVKHSDVYNKYLPMLTIFLGTGCRVGELLGLCWSDIDFSNRTIKISRTLSYLQDESGKYKYMISSPKTASGVRTIPMFDEVYDAFINVKERYDYNDIGSPVVDGVSGFIFLTRNNTLMNFVLVRNVLRNIVAKHNQFELESCEKTGKTPFILPNISPHILRHTFCTRLCESGCNPKIIQEIMGHSNISITMDVYTDVSEGYLKESINKISNKMIIT